MDNKTYYLYVLRHPVTNELRYVGQTSQNPKQRLSAHVSSACNPTSIVSKWTLKLKRNALRPVMQIVAKSTVSDYIDKLEITAIRGLRKRGFRLLNQARGGKVNRGHKMPESHRKSVSERFKGKPSHRRGKQIPRESVEKTIATLAKRRAEGKYAPRKTTPETLAKIKATKQAKGTFNRKRTAREIEIVSEANRRRWKEDHEWIAKQSTLCAANAEKSRQRWADPEYKARVSAASKAAKAARTPEQIAKNAQRQSEVWKDPEYKARRSEAIREGIRRAKSRKEATNQHEEPSPDD